MNARFVLTTSPSKDSRVSDNRWCKIFENVKAGNNNRINCTIPGNNLKVPNENKVFPNRWIGRKTFI